MNGSRRVRGYVLRFLIVVCFVILTQAYVIEEKGTSVVKMLSDWPAGESVAALPWLVWEGTSHCG